MRSRTWRIAAAAMVVIAPSLSVLVAPAKAGATLEAIRARDYVHCGSNTNLPGFSVIDQQGQWHGIDIDYCRAFAAAVLGDASKEQFTPTTAQQRFTALQS